jgi:hypothetical protein
MNGENLTMFERYFNQEMGEEEKIEFELRLETDSKFKSEYEEYKAIYDAIGDEEVIELRKQLKKLGEKHRDGRLGGRIIGNGNNWFWLAALLIVSLSIISITYLWVSSPMTPQFLGLRNGSRAIQQEIYSLEPAYEELIRYRVRSEDFTLGQPRDSIVVKKKSDIRFEWTYHKDKELYFDVMNKSGIVVFSAGPGIQSPFLMTKNLPRGVFIYRFRTASQTLLTGLFYVV